MRKKPDNLTEESFISRWSRKKSEPEEKDPAEKYLDSLSDSASSGELTTQNEKSESTDEVKALTDADMPDIETLDENSDYAGFMSEGVSEELRTIALRKLFRSAGFNIRDGLDDYDDDFTSFPALGDLITSDMKHQMEMREKRQREEEENENKLSEENEMTAQQGEVDSREEQDQQTDQQDEPIVSDGSEIDPQSESGSRPRKKSDV